MFNANYRLLVKSESFPDDNVICLGSQLALIVYVLKDLLPKHEWYGADVDGVGKDIYEKGLNGTQLGIIGSDLDFIRYCSDIDQFVWGVFVCIDTISSSKNIQELELGTEDVPFRTINCSGILLEIRTFDTSYFEIYSDDKNFIETLGLKLNSSEFSCKNE